MTLLVTSLIGRRRVKRYGWFNGIQGHMKLFTQIDVASMLRLCEN
jgi:hypothetical protein